MSSLCSDKYCKLSMNLWQHQQITDEEKKIYQEKLEKLNVKKISSKMKYANAIKNKSVGASFNNSNIMLRSAYYKECQ
jgi:hypothetical protein